MAAIVVLFALLAVVLPQWSYGDAISQLEKASGGKIEIPSPGNPKPTGIEWIRCPHCKKWIEIHFGRVPATCPFCGHSLAGPATSDVTNQIVSKISRYNESAVTTSNAFKASLHRSQVDAADLKRLNGKFNVIVAGQTNEFEKEKSDLFSIHTSIHTYVEDQKTNRSNYSTPKVRELGPLANLSDQELEQRYEADEAEIQRIALDAKRRSENTAKQQAMRSQTEGDVNEAGTNWGNAKSDAALDAGFALAGEGALQAGYKKTAKVIGTADQGRTIFSGAKDISDSFPQTAGQNQTKTDPSGSYDVIKSEGTYNSPWSPEYESYNPESSQNFKTGVNLNEFSNVDFTTLDSSRHQPSENQNAEWDKAALSVETPHPQLIADQSASQNTFNTSKAGIAAGEMALSFAGPEAGLALTSGKYVIEAGVAQGNYSLYGSLINQYNDFDEASAKYASFYTQRLRDLKKDQADIKAEQARRARMRKE